MFHVDVRQGVLQHSFETLKNGHPNFGRGGVESQFFDENSDKTIDNVPGDEGIEVFEDPAGSRDGRNPNVQVIIPEQVGHGFVLQFLLSGPLLHQQVLVLERVGGHEQLTGVQTDHAVGHLRRWKEVGNKR